MVIFFFPKYGCSSFCPNLGLMCIFIIEKGGFGSQLDVTSAVRVSKQSVFQVRSCERKVHRWKP